MGELKKGTLWVCGTPIGNMGDMTLRALEVLKSVGLIACEDTRRTRKLLAKYGIDAPLTSYHAHSPDLKANALMEALESGQDVALVSDAGMPCISDPGADLVDQAYSRGIPVKAVPGPSSIITALSVSGLKARRFFFEGFLPRERRRRRKRLKEILDSGVLRDSVLILFEAPHRLASSLGDIRELLGDRLVVVARELTKVHEQVLRGRISEVVKELREVRGEFVILVGPEDPTEHRAQHKGFTVRPADAEIALDRVRLLMAQGRSRKDAVATVARESGISKKALYALSLCEPGPLPIDEADVDGNGPFAVSAAPRIRKTNPSAAESEGQRL